MKPEKVFYIVTSFVGLLLTLWAAFCTDNKLVTCILCALITVVIVVGGEILFFLPNKLYDRLKADNEILDQIKYLKRERNILSNIITISGELKKFIEDKIDHLPHFANSVFRQSLTVKLEMLNKELKKFNDSGILEIKGEDSYEATIACMIGATEQVFAISYPDIEFWNTKGMTYLNANKETLRKSPALEIHRFFVIRQKDESVLSEPRLDDFVDVLKSQVWDVTKPTGIRVYITHQKLFNKFYHSNNPLHDIPDISLYDSKVASLWKDRSSNTTNEIYVDETHICYEGEMLDEAKRYKKNFLDNYTTHSVRIEFPSHVTHDQLEEIIRQKIGQLKERLLKGGIKLSNAEAN